MTLPAYFPDLSKQGKLQRSPWYASAMEHLLSVVQALSQARDVATITRIARDAARELTGADGATFVLRDNDKCYYADENAIQPLWKGKRFPLEMCISGWVMLNARPVTIFDIYDDPRVPTEAYRPTFVKSLAMVPIRRANPIGAIGNYWAHNHQPTDEQVSVLQALADTTSVALENARLIEDLRQKVETLETQQARIEAQHESLEVFTHALAHDLKEPVRTVRAFTDLIAESGGKGEADSTYFEFIQNAADRMAMLVDTVFAYTQLHDPARLTKCVCPMGDMLTGAQANLRQLIEEHGAQVTAHPLPVVDAHPGHMMQVLQNLINNAIKHTYGPVTIDISATDEGDNWKFRVQDNGPGIDSDNVVRIFQPFKRLNLNEEGAGLGLSICAKIVSLHGGRIWCESAPGEGTTFLFTIPKPGETAQPNPEAATDMNKTHGGSEADPLARVLLVDDREADLELTRVLLRDRDKIQCDMTLARSGSEALKAMRTARDAGYPFDLILLDINMPGMDGFETLEAMRAEPDLSETAVVMCTGSTYDRDVEQAQTLGAIGYMVKPASAAQLKPVVDRIATLKWQGEGKESRLLRVA